MSDNVELYGKVLSFLAGEFARKEGRQCVGFDLFYAPGNGFREEEVRKWVRADEPELFDDFVKLEELVKKIIDIAEGEADAKPAGKHRFVIRTHQHLGGRGMLSFALSPQFSGNPDETSLVPSGGGAGGQANILAQHSNQLMRINAQMFEGTIRVLGQQNMALHQEVSELRAENIILRREVDEARSNKMEKEFHFAMSAEKNARTNAAFQKVLQIGSVVAAKIAGGDDNASGPASPLAMLVKDFGGSLRREQIDVLMSTLDVAQKMMFMEIMNMVNPPEPQQPTPGSSAPASLPSSGSNGVVFPGSKAP